jgi:hypothetical protein
MPSFSKSFGAAPKLETESRYLRVTLSSAIELIRQSIRRTAARRSGLVVADDRCVRPRKPLARGRRRGQVVALAELGLGDLLAREPVA